MKNPDAHPDICAVLAIRNSDGEYVMVQGTSNGEYAALRTAESAGLGGARKIASRTNIAVVNGNSVDFLIEADGENGGGEVLPSDMEIQAIIIQPHDGASPPVAVSTKWTFQLYTHSDREVDDIFFGTDRTDREATDDEFVVNGKMGYINEEGRTEIPCRLTIPGGQTDATFTVKVIFS